MSTLELRLGNETATVTGGDLTSPSFSRFNVGQLSLVSDAW